MTMAGAASASASDHREGGQQPAPVAKLTKRQRRCRGSNPSTTWQHQPKIKSASERARAYISHAGLADDGVHHVDGGTGRWEEGMAQPPSSSVRKKAKSSTDLLDPRLDLHSPEVRFGRLLGGTDQRSRHIAVKMLREYLRARSDISNGVGLSELDLLKLWKGLWYTIYMADKVPVQEKLSKLLAEMMWCLSGTEEEDEYAGQAYLRIGEDGDNSDDDNDSLLRREGILVDQDGDTMEIINAHTGIDAGDGGIKGESVVVEEDQEEEDGDGEKRIRDMNEAHCRGAHLVSLYVSTFFCTLRREWGNVDKHRVDKFYTAVRFMVSEAYNYMSKRHWNLGIIRLFNDVLYSEGLSSYTPNLTNGLRYHLIDICIEELAKVNADADLPLTEETFLDCIEPFLALAKQAADKSVQKRVTDHVLLKFLNEFSFVSSDVTVYGGKSLVFDQVHVGTVSKFIFEVAGEADTDERFRKSLYEMYKTYTRRIRAAGKDVNMDQHSDDDAMEAAKEEADSSENCPAKKICDVGGKAQSAAEKSEEPNGGKDGNDEENVKDSTGSTSEMKTFVDSILSVKDRDDNSAASSAKKNEQNKERKRAKGKTRNFNDIETLKSEAALDGKGLNTTDEENLMAGASPKNNTCDGKSPSMKKRNMNHAVSSKYARVDGDESKTAQDTESKVVASLEISSTEKVAKENDYKEATRKTRSKKRRKKRNVESSEAKSPYPISSDTDTAGGESKISATVKGKSFNEEKIFGSLSSTMASPLKKKKKKKNAESRNSKPAVALDASASKRVSFGKMNHCKSYKASMKALKTLDQDRWDTTGRTPDKGILLYSARG